VNIATATTTVVKSGAGRLVRIMNNRKVANGVITVYDNTAASGTLIGTITNPASLLDSAQPFEYDCDFGTGLTIVTSSTDNITVVYE
jgi:hypothetical protein